MEMFLNTKTDYNRLLFMKSHCRSAENKSCLKSLKKISHNSTKGGPFGLAGGQIREGRSTFF